MPYADNGRVRIHYQVEGEGPALVLQYGFTESLGDWYETGYIEPLRPDFRLILIDARGHGASAPPPAFCRPKGLLLHSSGLHWMSTRSTATVRGKHEPLPPGEDCGMSTPHRRGMYNLFWI